MLTVPGGVDTVREVTITPPRADRASVAYLLASVGMSVQTAADTLPPDPTAVTLDAATRRLVVTFGSYEHLVEWSRALRMGQPGYAPSPTTGRFEWTATAFLAGWSTTLRHEQPRSIPDQGEPGGGPADSHTTVPRGNR